MANTFNAITTGTGGIATTGDASGAFSFTKDGGSAEVYIDSSGNVGIGTSSPSAKLNVTGTSVVANFESTNNNNVIGVIYNGSTGGYIGASASTLQFSNSSGTGVAAINSTNFQFNSGYGSVATAYGCRAWVHFSGTTIRASGNVSSITQRSTGDYTVTFTNAMVDKNYAVTGMVSDDASSNRGFNIQNTYTVGMNTNYCYVTVFAASTPTAVTVAFIR